MKRDRRSSWSWLSLILLAVVLGLSAPVHALAAHGGSEGASHLHSTCGVCFTLAGVENPPACLAPTVATDDRRAALPADETLVPYGVPSPSAPPRAPPSLLAS